MLPKNTITALSYDISLTVLSNLNLQCNVRFLSRKIPFKHSLDFKGELLIKVGCKLKSPKRRIPERWRSGGGTCNPNFHMVCVSGWWWW